MMQSGLFDNGNFREYSYFSGGGILQSWNGNSRWPCGPALSSQYGPVLAVNGSFFVTYCCCISDSIDRHSPQ